MTKIQTEQLAGLTLGQATAYIDHYSPELLQAVPRTLGRQAIGLGAQLPFVGQDTWHGYELSWLSPKGKPMVALATFVVPFDTPNLIESKSFKLYLNSLNQTKFADISQLYRTIKTDLSACAGGPVQVTLHNVNELTAFQPTWLPGRCIDDLDIEVEHYDYKPAVATKANRGCGRRKAAFAFTEIQLLNHLSARLGQCLYSLQRQSCGSCIFAEVPDQFQKSQ